CIWRFVCKNLKSMDHDICGAQFDWLTFPRQLISRNSIQLFRGKRRRHLFDQSEKSCCEIADFLNAKFRIFSIANRNAIGIVCVGRKSKSDCSDVALSVMLEKLRQPRKPPQQQRQYSGHHWVERSEMADRRLTSQLTHPRDNVMRGRASRFVDDQ